MTLLILIIVAVVVIGYFISTQRSLVNSDELCKNALSQIEVQLNSRWDAVLALAKTAAQYAKHESETLIEVIQQRRGEQVNTRTDKCLGTSHGPTHRHRRGLPRTEGCRTLSGSHGRNEAVRGERPHISYGLQ